MPHDSQAQTRMYPSAAEPAARVAGPLIEQRTQRSLAKAGVLVALGVLVWSGMQRPRRRYMRLHSWTGIALIGFTLWHWSLYMPRPERRVRAAGDAAAGAPRRLSSPRGSGD